MEVANGCIGEQQLFASMSSIARVMALGAMTDHCLTRRRSRHRMICALSQLSEEIEVPTI
jgi:hypothetical protein